LVRNCQRTRLARVIRLDRHLLARSVGLDGEQVAEDLALVVAVHGAIGGRVEHLRALCRRHLAQRAKCAAHLLLALGIHVAELLRGVADGLTAVRSEALHILYAAEGALPLLRGHGVQLMEPVDEALLLLLGQAIESRLAAERILLAGERLPLMALQPVAEMGATHISRRCAVRAANGGIRIVSARAGCGGHHIPVVQRGSGAGRSTAIGGRGLGRSICGLWGRR
jgi:hypothetical protein